MLSMGAPPPYPRQGIESPAPPIAENPASAGFSAFGGTEHHCPQRRYAGNPTLFFHPSVTVGFGVRQGRRSFGRWGWATMRFCSNLGQMWLDTAREKRYFPRRQGGSSTYLPITEIPALYGDFGNEGAGVPPATWWGNLLISRKLQRPADLGGPVCIPSGGVWCRSAQ